MKRPFFRAAALVVASGFALPLFGQPARADDSVTLLWYSPDPASLGNGVRRQVAQLGGRYVFEGGPGFSRQRSHEGSTGVAGLLSALTAAPGAEHPYVQNGYSPLQSMRVLAADSAHRITDSATLAAQGPYPAGFLANFPGVVRIIRL